MFIVLEGLDSAGKTTQARRLVEYLEPASYLKFPDWESFTGRLIRSHLAEEWKAIVAVSESKFALQQNVVDAAMFQCMQTVNRMELLPDDIWDDNNRSGITIADRYMPSAIAYGLADGLPEEWLWKTQLRLPQPDLYVLLDIDEATSLARRPNRQDRYEKASLEQTRQNYLRVFAEGPQRCPRATWTTIDGRPSENDVFSAILAAIDAR